MRQISKTKSYLEETIMKKTLGILVLGCSLVCLPPQLLAQEIVHALCGTVSSINPADKTITLFQDTGSPATFNVMNSSRTRIAFDKKVAAEVTAAKEFQKKGAYVILFYFGTQENRTAVAVKSLGAGPFSSTSGEVTDWNGHSNTLSVRGKDGAVYSYKIGPKTVVETYMGVVNGEKVDLDKGDRVRLVSSSEDGTPTALFIREE
jgi:hypothetical protein